MTGLSFLYKQTASDRPVHFSKRGMPKGSTPSDVLAAIREELKSAGLDQSNFNTINVVHCVMEYGVVPTTVFDSSKASDYIKFNAKILPSDYIAWDQVESPSVNVVYVPLVNVNNYLFDNFGEFEYYHSATILLRALQRPSEPDEKRVYVHLSSAQFDLIIFEGEQLLLCNSYPFTTPEDFIYYTLFAFEQLKLDPENVVVLLLGEVSLEDAIYEIAYRYIRHVSILEIPQQIIEADLPGLEDAYLLTNVV